MKKTLVVLILMLALLTSCLVGCVTTPDNSDSGNSNAASPKENAAAVFTLDVNPGVRVYVKEDNTVITVEATNADGEEVVAELDIEGANYEAVVEEIIDKMDEKGYLDGENSSVLISVEKKVIDISEKVNDKIHKVFEKHGKRASVIEQELDKLDKKVEDAIGKIAKEHKISEGKAHLIEKIREEFPELSEEELAALNVNDLGMMLEDTSDDIKGHFKKIEDAVEDAYVGREQALATALESLGNLELTVDNITMQRVRVARGEGKMLYLVEFVYDGMEYEITVDAKTGEIITIKSREFEEFDAKGFIDDFCHKNDIGMEEIKNQVKDEIFGKDEHKGENGKREEKPLSRGELLKGLMASLNISEDTLKRTDVKLYETESGTVYRITVEVNNGDVYKLIVEAYSGTVLEAELNDSTMKISD